LSWYIYLIAAPSCSIPSALAPGYRLERFYTPLSSVYSNSAVTPAVIGIFINGFSFDSYGPQLHRHHPHHAARRE